MTTKYSPQSIIFRDNCLEGEAARPRSPAPGPACSMWCPQRTSQVRLSTGTRGWDSKWGLGESEEKYYIKKITGIIGTNQPQRILVERKELQAWTHKMAKIGLTKDLWNIKVNQSEEPIKQEWLMVVGFCLISNYWKILERVSRSQQTWMQLNTHHLMHENVIFCHT